MPFILLVALAIQVVPAGTSPDTVAVLRKEARRAEHRYERLLRALAPEAMGGGYGRDCDEVVGRFCLRYDDDGQPPDDTARAERIQIVEARKAAIDAFRRLFSYTPGDVHVAGPLVRYLAEDGRRQEAVSAARSFAWATSDSIWGPLLLGFALHNDGRELTAERQFALALTRMPPEQREEFQDLHVLLTDAEWHRVQAMNPAQRARYEHTFWRLADPLYVTPGDERWNEHIARHVWARLLSQAPRVAGTVSWGKDLEELTLRYGVPTSRERLQGREWWSFNMIEHFSPRAQAFTTSDLHTQGYMAQPVPGAPDPLDSARVRSSFAPSNVSRLVPFPHQVARFPAAGDRVTVRVDAELPLDSLGSSARDLRTGIFMLDTTANLLAKQENRQRTYGRVVRVTGEFTLAPGQVIYSVEAYDSVSHRGARARYALPLDGYAAGQPALSDVLLTRPFGDGLLPRSRDDLRDAALAGAIVTAGNNLGIYAEAHRLAGDAAGRTHYTVEIAVEKARGPSLAARVAHWFGRAIGLAHDRPPPSVSWTADGTAGEPVIVAVDLEMDDARPGLYAIRLAVRDRVLGVRMQTRRLVRVEAGP
ncbi:MAG: hypothetical protein P8Z36_00965 [Gemmatimonadota bacterium]|jgi:hypothetical protein